MNDLDWTAGDMDDLARSDALDDVIGETVDTLRDERMRASYERAAWRRLVEMEGRLTRLLDGQWYASAPSGRAERYSDGSGDYEPMIHSDHCDEQIDAVNDCWRKWVAAGRPRQLFEMECCFDWEPEPRDGAGPYWPETADAG